MSRNQEVHRADLRTLVAPREGRVSRNRCVYIRSTLEDVAPREGRVSRNGRAAPQALRAAGRAPRGACE